MDKNHKAKYAHTLVSPRITEKANDLALRNVHAFIVDDKATKHDVGAAVKAFYNVKPIKVAIVRNPAKKVIVRGKYGVKGGVKKAYVYLKKGDKIE